MSPQLRVHCRTYVLPGNALDALLIIALPVSASGMWESASCDERVRGVQSVGGLDSSLRGTYMAQDSLPSEHHPRDCKAVPNYGGSTLFAENPLGTDAHVHLAAGALQRRSGG